MTATTKEQLGAETALRKYYVDVNFATYDTPVWKPLNGIYNCKPIQTPSVKDSSDFDSDFGSDGVTLIKWGVEVKVWRKRRVSSPTEYDEAQEFLRALGSKVLGANVADIRYYEMVENGPQEEAYRGYAAVSWVPDGGATEDYDSITIGLLGRGTREEITHPDSVENVPTVASVTPATGGTAGGEAVVIRGQYFTGATHVKFDTDDAADFEVIDDYTIAVVTPALAADTYTVYVTNATGTNATGPTYTTS